MTTGISMCPLCTYMCFAFSFADVYNLLLCNVYSVGPEERLDISNCAVCVNEVVIITKQDKS